MKEHTLTSLINSGDKLKGLNSYQTLITCKHGSKEIIAEVVDTLSFDLPKFPRFCKGFSVFETYSCLTKAGNKAGNSRLVNQASVICKMLECIIQEIIMGYLENHNTIEQS